MTMTQQAPDKIVNREVGDVPAATHKVLHVERGINDQITGFREERVSQLPRALGALGNPSFDMLTEARTETGKARRRSLLEAWIDQPDAANLLRDGIRYLAFSRMRGLPKIWPMIAQPEQSDRPQEEYMRDATIGIIPRVPSGQTVPFIKSDFEGDTTIKNHLYRVGVYVNGDDILFDRLGKIRQIAQELGRAAAVTEDYEFFTTITTTANYTRNSTTNDNDVGANQATTTFNALGLDTALTTISTSKDRKSGQYLGYNADTFITTPKMEFPVKQFLMSPNLARQHGNTTAEVRGMGTENVYNGIFNRIIISPWFGSNYEWAVLDSSVFSYVWQTVQPWNIMQEGMVESSEAWLMNHAIRYVIMGYFGQGFVDDRAWFFSDSTTAPTVS
jgi:hypothetical protein